MLEEKKEETKVEEQTTENPASGSEQKPSEESKEEYYKSELEKMKAEKEAKEAQLAKAEYKLTEQDKKLREQRSQKDDDPEPEDDDIPEDVDTKINSFKQELANSQLQEELSKIENPDERELTRQYYEGKLQHSGLTAGAIKEDVANARYLANRAKYEKRISELNKANSSNQSASKDYGAAGDFEQPKPVNTLTDAEKRILERNGLKPEDVGKSISELSNK
jgi:hypothetical protein